MTKEIETIVLIFKVQEKPKEINKPMVHRQNEDSLSSIKKLSAFSHALFYTRLPVESRLLNLESLHNK
jgi:hypothetical protein